MKNAKPIALVDIPYLNHGIYNEDEHEAFVKKQGKKAKKALKKYYVVLIQSFMTEDESARITVRVIK